MSCVSPAVAQVGFARAPSLGSSGACAACASLAVQRLSCLLAMTVGRWCGSRRGGAVWDGRAGAGSFARAPLSGPSGGAAACTNLDL